MRSPFPGMDPYLESPELWPGIHNALIVAIQRELAPLLKPRYFVALEERTYLAEPEGLVLIGVPDVTVHRAGPRPERGVDQEASPGKLSDATAVAVQVPVPERIRETWLQIRAVDSGEVVTVLEILSPTNKSAGEGRRLYLAKRMAVLGTRTHLVEIDLLRAGEAMPVHGTEVSADYRILVSRGDRRPQAALHPFGVRDPVPQIRVPLRSTDESVVLDLGALLADHYERIGYELRIDYSADPVPPLSDDDRKWAGELLVASGIRSGPSSDARR